MIPSRKHKFGPDFDTATARVTPLKSEPNIAVARDNLAGILQEVRKRRAQQQIAARVEAVVHGAPTSRASALLSSFTPPSQSSQPSTWTLSSHASASSSVSSASSAHHVLRDLEDKTLEEVLAMEDTRALVKDYARSLLSEDLVDFCVALLPFHQIFDQQTSPRGPSAASPEDLRFILKHFPIRTGIGIDSHVPILSRPLSRALGKALKPRSESKRAVVEESEYERGYSQYSKDASSASSDSPTSSAKKSSHSSSSTATSTVHQVTASVLVAPGVVALLEKAWQEVAPIVETEILNPLRCEAALYSYDHHRGQEVLQDPDRSIASGERAV